MSTRTIWQDLYGIEVETGTTLATHLGSNPGMAAATDKGIQGTGSGAGKFALPLTDHPNIKAPNATVESEQARGISSRHQREYNIVTTGEPVELSLPMLGDVYSLNTFLALFFQSGMTEANGTDNSGSTGSDNTGLSRFACVPYTQADITTLAHLVRALQPATGADTIDLLAQGVICDQLNINGEAGQPVSFEANVKAAKWSQVRLGNTPGLGITANLANSFHSTTPLKFQDSTIAIFDGSNWVEVFSPSISFSLNNNANFNFYNANQASSIHLGRLGVEGSITIPFGQTTLGNNYMVDKFLEGNPMRIAWFWGAKAGVVTLAEDFNLGAWNESDSDTYDSFKNDSAAQNPNPMNFFSIVANVRVSDYEMTGENELQVECTLQGVTDDNYNAIEIYGIYDKTKLDRLA